MRTPILALAVLATAGCTVSPVPAATVKAVGGPSARQLAHGRWMRMPAVPIRLCDPRAVWDGRDLLLIEPGFLPCHPAAAAYDPEANAWTVIAAPPLAVGEVPVDAFGGGRLVLVSPVTGATYTWSLATGQWRRVDVLPLKEVVSVSWTGSYFLAIAARWTGVNRGTTRTFALRGERWAALPALPEPRRGWVAGAVTMAYRGGTYALVDTEVSHTNPNDSYNFVSVGLRQLTAAGWQPVRLPAGSPVTQLMPTEVSGAILVAGSSCPGVCTQEVGAAALLWLGPRPRVLVLHPGPGVPYPYDIAAGASAVVVTYPSGSLGRLMAPGYGPAPGLTMIYAIAARRWLKGPTVPGVSADRLAWSAYWTPSGVISLGASEPGMGDHVTKSWILRPGA